MVSLGYLHPLENLCPPPYALSSNHFNLQAPAPVCSSHKIVEGVKNSTKFPLSNAEEKHVDTYMVMSTTKNKTRTKYSNKLPKK